MRLSKTSLDNGSEYEYDRALDNADVIYVNETVSKAGNDMIVLTFGINGPNGGVRIDNYITVNYAPRIQQMVEALASEHLEDWESTGDIDINPQDLLGRSCRVKVVGEEWEGKTRPKVNKMFPIEL
jgi:hypothetical protein